MVGSIKNRIAAFEDLAVQSKSSSQIMAIVPPSPGFSATKRLGQSYRPKETSGFVQPVISKSKAPMQNTTAVMQNTTAVEKRQMMVKSSRDQQFAADLDVYQTYKAEKKAKNDAAETEEDREGNGNDQVEEESTLSEADPLSPVKTIQVSDDSSRENVEDRDELSISPLSFQGYQVESKHVAVPSVQQVEPIEEEVVESETAEEITLDEVIGKIDDTAQVSPTHPDNDVKNKAEPTLPNDVKNKETIDFMGQSSAPDDNGSNPLFEEREVISPLSPLGSKSSDSESSSYFMMNPNIGNIADVSVASEDDPFSDDFEEIRQELQATALEHKARSNAHSLPYSAPLHYPNEEEQIAARAEDTQTNTPENREQYNLLSSNGESSGSTSGILEDVEESSFTDYLNDLHPVPARLDKVLDEGDANEDDLNIPVIRSMGSGSSKSNDMTYSSGSVEGTRERAAHKRPISHALSEQSREREMMNGGYDRSDQHGENTERGMNEGRNQPLDDISPVIYPEEDFREDDYDEEVIQNVYYKQDTNIHPNRNCHQDEIKLQQYEDNEGSDEEEEFTSFQTANVLSSEEEDSERTDVLRNKDDSIEHTFLGLNEEDLDDDADETTFDDESDLIGVDIDDESAASNTHDRNVNNVSTKIHQQSTDDNAANILLEHDMNDYSAQPIQLAPIDEYNVPDYLSDTYNVQPVHNATNPLPDESSPSASDLHMQSGTVLPPSNNGLMYDQLQHEDSLSQLTDASFDVEPVRSKWPLADDQQQQQQRNEPVSDYSLMTYSTTENSSSGIIQSKPDNTPIFRQRNSLHENKRIFGESNPVITNSQSNVSEITDPMGGMKRRPTYPKVHKRKNNEEVVVLSTISGPMKMSTNNTKPSRGRSPSRFSRKDSNRTNVSKESYVNNTSTPSFATPSFATPSFDGSQGKQGELKKTNSRFSIRSLSPFRRNSTKSNKSNGNGNGKNKPYRGPMSHIESSRINRPVTPSDILREDEHRENSIPLVAVASSDDSSLDKRRKPKKKFSWRSLSPFRRRESKRKSRKADPFDEGDDSI